jgi:hypothetical protein
MIAFGRIDLRNLSGVASCEYCQRRLEYLNQELVNKSDKQSKERRAAVSERFRLENGSYSLEGSVRALLHKAVIKSLVTVPPVPVVQCSSSVFS